MRPAFRAPSCGGEARNLDWREWGKPQARTRRPRAVKNRGDQSCPEESDAVIARSAATKQSSLEARRGLLRAACPWACRRQDPGARNDERAKRCVNFSRRPCESRDPYAPADIWRRSEMTLRLSQRIPISTVDMGPCFRRDDPECGAQAGLARAAANNRGDHARG